MLDLELYQIVCINFEYLGIGSLVELIFVRWDSSLSASEVRLELSYADGVSGEVGRC